MIRKQLYLDAIQDKALKQRARELGLSEAEIVRRALDSVLFEGSAPQGQRHLASFLKQAEELAEAYRPTDSYRFDRQALYEEDDRFKRWNA
jgi:hypothetical protein